MSFDLRSLALYRFLIGFIVMADVLYRWGDLQDFYTDIGLVPRALFLSEMGMPWSFSLHFANGSLGYAYFLFGMQFLFGLMLVFGYKTRWSMFFSFVLNVSVHNRDWLVNNGGDDILRAILLLSIFLPLNKCFSIDSALEEKNDTPDYSNPHFSTWGLAFFLQVFVIYFVSYILKDHPIWRKDFTAVYYASRLDIFASPLGYWLRNFPTFQKMTTLFTIYLEWLGPILLVFSFLLGRFWWIGRVTVVILFWFLHAGIILTMWIGVFPFTCIAMWAIFLPGPMWDKIFVDLRKRFGVLTLYFDEECNFCKKSVYIIREFFLLPETIISPAQKNHDALTLMKKSNSWVIIGPKGEKHSQYGAFLEIMKQSPLLLPLRFIAARNPIKKIGEITYRWVSNHRGEMSKISQFFPSTQPKKKIKTASVIYQVSGLVIFLTLLTWNISTIKKWGFKSPFFQEIARYTHLYQEWNMFAPFPKMDNVWIEINARLSDGTEIELLTGSRDIYSVKNEKFYKTVKNEHWRKLYLNIADRSDYARYFGGFLCRKWNDRGIKLAPNTTLRKLEIVSFSQPILPNNEHGGIRKNLSWNHWCFDEDFKRESGVKK